MKPATKLLLVDDDKWQASYYVEALRDVGFDVTHVGNSDKALQQIADPGYQIVVLDLMMDPGGSFTQEESAAGHTTGWLLARRARRALPRATLAVLSAMNSPEVARWCEAQRPPVLFFTKAASSPSHFAQAIKTAHFEARNPDIAAVQETLFRFHAVAKQLTRRHASRNTIAVEDEYDVQDLLAALLKSRFDDVRAEEWVASYAGGSSRIDFLIQESSIAIEVKKTRAGLTDAKLGEQLIVDIARYRKHPTCNTLICFVYDPDALINNPRGLQSDLEQLSSPELQVLIEVSPANTR